MSWSASSRPDGVPVRQAPFIAPHVPAARYGRPEANRLIIGGDAVPQSGQGHVTSGTTAARPGRRAARVEVHSIDQIPLAERHGRVRDQFTLWFGLNANIFVVVLGGETVFLGLDLLWAGIAIVGGVLIGLVLVGFHAIQGPKLGVPQMIQSRGQFGFYGAVVVFAASIVLDVGFLAAQLVIQADAMNLLVSGVSIPTWIAILVVPVVVLTVFGYDWIHRFQRVMTPSSHPPRFGVSSHAASAFVAWPVDCRSG
jgi:hypothetical protein